MRRRLVLALLLVGLMAFPGSAHATARRFDAGLFIPVIGNIVTAEDVDADAGQPIDITRTFASGVPYIVLWMNTVGAYEGAPLLIKVTRLDCDEAESDTWDFEMRGSGSTRRHCMHW